MTLSEVTFIIAENRWPDRTRALCDYISHHVSAKIVVKGDLPIAGDKSHYDKFCALGLHAVFETGHALVCQLDGYPVNWDSWDDEFLNYDYIGAPWPPGWTREDDRVGNGGFSLRSKKLCLELSQCEWTPMADDVFICQHMGASLREKGIRFAPPSLAARFSIEHAVPEAAARPFGFHDTRLHPYRRF